MGNDVHVNFRRFAQEAVSGGKIEVFLPSLFDGTAEDDLRDVLFADGRGNGIGNADAAKLEHGGAEIVREAKIGGDGAAIFVAVAASSVDVNDVEFGIETSRHASGASDEVLRGRIRADTDGNPFADRPIFLNVFRGHVIL